MSSRVRFGPEAEAELREAVRWYEQRHDGLGLAFLAGIEDAVDAIARWPQSGSPVSEVERVVIRRSRVNRFPYHLAYLVVDNEIRVLAIAHDHRRPGYWIQRVGEE